MPVTISKISSIDPKTLAACERILASIPESSALNSLWQQYLNKPDQYTLWLGWFNERVVGFLWLEDQCIQGFAVHLATQGRGVGSRMAQLINEHYPVAKWPTTLQHFEQK